MRRARGPIALLATVLVCGAGALGAWAGAGRLQAVAYRDGHTRPRALAFNAADGMLYVALSTADAVAVIDPGPPPAAALPGPPPPAALPGPPPAGLRAPRIVARLEACRFPNAVAAVPGGGALVTCRFEPGLRRVARDARGRWRVTVIGAGPEAGDRGVAVAPSGELAYVASPAARGVKVVALAGAGKGESGGVRQVVPTGISPRALRLVPAGTLPEQREALLLVGNFIDHTVTVHPVAADGTLGPVAQTIATDAPVLDLLVTPSPPALLLFTHEDRALSRARGPVEGLDSGVLVLPASGGRFQDPGQGRRAFVNASERQPEPVIELAAAALDPESRALAAVGAGSDNLLLGLTATARGLDGAVAVPVGTNPTAIAALPGGRWVTADRLSDTLTFVADGGRAVTTLTVGVPERRSLADRGEVLFYGRALVPNNKADGPLSLYTCAACHDDGHVDGRRHPAKRNRFFSMTKTCRGLGTTAPYLSLGEPETIEAFADNIVATHAQGADVAPDRFDKYDATLRLRAGSGWRTAVLPAAEIRAALAAYMARIPPEPSPFVASARRALAPDERQGLELFRGSCSGCHQLVASTPDGLRIPAADLDRRLLAGQVALTSPRLYDVGTPVLGKDGNNPPSLRGVWDAAPYFSDGSARTLEEVLRRTAPGQPRVHAPANAERPPAFSPEARAALLAFLKAL